MARKILRRDKVAKMTIWPSQVEASIMGEPKTFGGPLHPEWYAREAMLGHILASLVDEGVETIEIRVESADD